MCYSAMVEQNCKTLGQRFKARVQIDMYDDLFTRRLVGEKIVLNKLLEQPFTKNAVNETEHSISSKILQWHELETVRLKNDLSIQKSRLQKALESLQRKETKKALDEKRIATNKIEKLTDDIRRHSTSEVLSEDEERIFPFHYFSMLTLNKKGEKVIVPARYLMRPHGKDQGFDKEYGGCYNARLDSLLTVPWWKDVFGKRHGLMLVKKFYENVPRTLYQKNFSLSESHAKASNLVLCFEPDSVEYMYIPTLWDFWEGKGPSLLSAALITDEPTAEVARAGHNRSPVFLKESAIDDWLNVSAYSPEEFLRILAEREFPHYSHRVLDVA